MKNSIFAAALALSIFVTPQMAASQNIGIQFDKMPVGTQMFYRHTNGDRWHEIYKGVQRGKHVLERFVGHSASSGRPIRTMYFDKAGRLLSYKAFGDRSKPYKQTFSPYSCYYTVGNCTHKLRFSGSGYVHSGTASKWVMNTKPVKGGYSTKWYKFREPDGGNTYFTKLGKYNLRTIESWGSKGQFNIKLVKVKTP